VARGFAPERMYDFSAVDSVNVFSGNPSVHLPVGPELRANGALPYQLTLAYNSHCWDYINSAVDADPQTLTAVPWKRSNAGIGWEVSLGRLYAPDVDNVINPKHVWIYEAPDGADHQMFVNLHGSGSDDAVHRYTRDSSYIRMTAVSAHVRKIELPGGMVHTFTELAKSSSGSWSTAVATTNEWRLTSIGDRFDNSVSVGYSSSATYSEIWTITDGPRTTSVYFRRDAALAPPSTTYDVTLDHIDVPAFGGGTAAYTCTYAGQSMPAGNGNSGGPASVVVSTLTQLTLPNGASYSMTYETSSTTSPGVLTQLHLPTGGNVQWTYDASDWPEASWEKAKGLLTPVPAVVSARIYGGGTWSYGRFPGAVSCWRTCGTNPQCVYGGNRQLTAWVTAPDGTTNISYFSTFVQGNTSRRGSDACNIESDRWDIGAYGLAFTPSGGSIPPDTQNGYPAPSEALKGTSAVLDAPTDLGRYLSTEVRTGFTAPGADRNGFGRMPGHGMPLRSTWVKYAHDDAAGDLHNLNPRQESALTRFDDDNGCAGGFCYTGARSFGFDGYGHFAQSSTLSNFPGSANFRTSYAAYDTGTDVTGAWLLGLYGEQCTADESQQRTDAIAACSDLAKALLTTSDFDRTTGVLKARRTRNINLASGEVDGVHDLLAAFEYDTVDHGLVSREKYYGGDLTSLSAASGFTTSSAADYQIDHTYTFSSGALAGAASRHHGLTFDDDRVTLDAATGLVSTAYDTAGLSTTYGYDNMGRVTTMTPPATQPTTYTYTDTTLPVRVVAETTTSGADSIASEYRFDDWGRLARTKSKMFDGSWSAVVTKYDALGRRSSVGMPEVLADSAADATHVTSYAYDALGRVISVNQPDSKQTSFAYTLIFNDPTGFQCTAVTMVGGERHETCLPNDATGWAEFFSGDVPAKLRLLKWQMQHDPVFRRAPGLSLLRNVRGAQAHRNDNGIAKLWWFYRVEKNKGPWDYKQLGRRYARFGNFHYGLVGAAAGIPLEILLRGAGFAQQQAGTSLPEWEMPFGPQGMSYTYGDDPEDQIFINLGYNTYYSDYANK
jgi:YD repeat-containing protein